MPTRRMLPDALALGLLSGMLMALRIALWHEAWNDRTFTLLVIALLAGFCAGLFTAFSLRLARRLIGLIRQPALVAVLFPCFHVGSTALLLQMHQGLVSGKSDDDMAFTAHAILYNAFYHHAFYLAFLPNYLLPLVLPVLTGAAMRLMRGPASGKA